MVQAGVKWGLLATLLMVGTLGCGGGSTGPAKYSVTGQVTFAGEPIDEGRIFFRMLDGDGRGFATEIREGDYSLEVLPGRMRVEILASRLIEGKFDTSNGTPEPMGEMYIPAKYNQKSELVATVSTEARNELNFSLDP